MKKSLLTLFVVIFSMGLAQNAFAGLFQGAANLVEGAGRAAGRTVEAAGRATGNVVSGTGRVLTGQPYAQPQSISRAYTTPTSTPPNQTVKPTTYDVWGNKKPTYRPFQQPVIGGAYK